jgi:hypothetical protein
VEPCRKAWASDPTSHIFLRMQIALLRVPDRCPIPSCFPVRNGLRPTHKDSASIRYLHPGLSLKQDSPSNTPSCHSSRSCTLCFTLQPTDSPDTPDWVRLAHVELLIVTYKRFGSRTRPRHAFAVSCRGKFSPDVTARTRPQATHPKRVTDEMNSFQFMRCETRSLVHAPLCGTCRFRP